MASFHLIFPKHFNPAVRAQPWCPACVHKPPEGTTANFHLWSAFSQEAPEQRDLHMTMMYTGHPSQKPWRRVEDAAGNIQVQDNTAKAQSLPVLYLIPAMHFLFTLQSPRMFCGLRKRVTSKVWLIQNCYRSTSLMQEWKKSVFGDIQQNKRLKDLRNKIKHISHKGK